MTAVHRVGVLVRGVTSAAVLLGMAIGVPAALVVTIGNPVPRGWTWDAPLTTSAFLGVLACVAWVFWVQLAICVVVEVASEIGSRSGRSGDWLTRAPGTLGAQQLMVRSLVRAVVAIGVTSTATAGTAPWIDHVAGPVAPMSAAPRADASPGADDRDQDVSSEEASRTVTVVRGDTLWSIAEKHLGAGERWNEIATLNTGHRMADGSTFDDARTILPGWTLLVPEVADSGEDVTVMPGDTLSKIAEEQYGDGSKWPRIYRANTGQIDDPHWIYPGQRFEIPGERPERPQRHQRDGANGDPRNAVPAEVEVEVEPTPSPIPTPEVEAEAAPETESEAGPNPVADTDAEDSGAQIDGATITRALVGGGGFLAAAMLAVYVGRRRTQSRNRPSGRAAPSVAPELRSEDKSLRAVGGPAGEKVAFLDSALRELAQLTEDREGELPQVAAAHIDGEGLDLHLSRPHVDPPGPWIATEDGSVWRLPRTHAAVANDRMMPYPAMVTLGDDDCGGTWLIDLEAAGVVQIVGEESTGGDLARFIAAEFALNPWADAEEVSIVGIGEEVAPLNCGRLTVARSLDVRALVKMACQAADGINSSGQEVLSARVAEWENAWVPIVTIGSVSQDDLDVHRKTTGDLVDAMRRTPTRTSVVFAAVTPVVLDERAIVLRLDGEDRLETPWGVVRPNRLTRSEATTLSALFDDAENEEDQPIPVAERADDQPSNVDEAGALVDGLTEERCGTGDPSSVLPRPDRAYIAAAATTEKDLAVLAPAVPPSKEAAAISADPTLDADLAEWWDVNSTRPKLTVLGPVELQAVGEKTAEVDSRPAYFAELAAYLTAHPAGRTPNEVAADFGIQNNTLHTRLGQLRKWLGKRPGSGEWYLPNALRVRGQQIYRIDGVLVDADLFRRLRSRAEACGPSGIGDLKQALELVQGVPYDQPRKRGYGWLSDTPFDHYLTAAVVDVAHIVATHALTEGEPRRALWAAEKAIAAAPSEDKPRLDLARAMQAMGDDAEAALYLRHEVFNRTDDDRAPLEPSERTDQVAATLRRRRQ